VTGAERGYFLKFLEEGALVEVFVDVSEDRGGERFEICAHAINILKNMRNIKT